MGTSPPLKMQKVLQTNLARKIFVLVAIPLVVQIVAVGIFACLLQQAEHERAREMHSRDVTAQINAIFNSLMSSMVAGMLYHGLGKEEDKERLLSERRLAARAEHELQSLIKGNPEEERKAAELAKVRSEMELCLKRAKHYAQEGDQLGTTKEWLKIQVLIDNFFNLLMRTAESDYSEREEQKQIQARDRQILELTLIIGVLLNVAVALGLTGALNKSITKRLRIIIDNANRLAAGRELNAPVGGQDEIARLDSVFRRMSNSLEEARRKERAILDNAAELICTIDAEGRFSEANAAAEAILGRYPDELIGLRLTEIVVPDEAERTYKAIKRIVQEAQNGRFETTVNRKGSAAVVQWSAQWSAQEKSLFCVAQDITERIRIEQLKRDFISMVSHDLRTPLTSIQMYLDLLSKGAYGTLTENGLDGLKNASNNSEQLVKLVSDLLDLEKIESGTLVLDIENHDLDMLIQTAINTCAGVAAKYKISIDLLDFSPIHVKADGDRLVQVLVNLMTNAAKFSPPGESILVKAEKKKDRVTISIFDHGPGVPEEKRERIFERFEQVGINKRAGVGLGLAICKRIIECHGGSIGVKSNNPRGSIFWFSLPAG